MTTEVASLPDVATRFGRVLARPQEEAAVTAPFEARISEPPSVGIGEIVRAGQPLVAIEPAFSAADAMTISARRAEIDGDVEAGTRELERLDAEAGRARTLAGPRIISAESLQRAETAVVSARAKLDALRHQRSTLDQRRTGVMLKAPIGGTVVVLDATPGARLAPDKVIARIVSPGPRWIDVLSPPESPPGDTYEITLADRTTPARLLAAGTSIDADGMRHDRLEVAPADAGSLLPGATVTVRVAVVERQGVVLPESAVVPGSGSDFVFVETQPATFEARVVLVGSRQAGRVRIDEGLAAGERVVVRGAMSLRGETLRGQLRHVE